MVSISSSARPAKAADGRQTYRVGGACANMPTCGERRGRTVVLGEAASEAVGAVVEEAPSVLWWLPLLERGGIEGQGGSIS